MRPRYPEDALYHFTTREAAFEHILPTAKLRLSRYSAMRDPLESKSWSFAAAYFMDGFKPGEDEELYARADQLLNSIKENSFLLAFTEHAIEGYEDEAGDFAHGYARARLWEQYAEAHRGVCIVFDRDKLLTMLTTGLSASSQTYLDAVEYTPSGTRGHPRAFDLNLEEFQSDVHVAGLKHLWRHYKALFFTKTLDWQSEHEFRAVTWMPDAEDPVYVSVEGAISAVIVGHAFPLWQMPSALDLCRRVGVEALAMDWSMDTPIPIALERRLKYQRRKALRGQSPPDGT